MADQQIQDQTTPLTIPAVVQALREELPDMTGRGVLLLTAHIHLETGLRSCHCWNVGNAKWSPGHDWCEFRCGEELEASVAEHERSHYPGLVVFKGARYWRDGREMQSVELLPPHPWTRFCAFGSLREGVADHIRLLRTGRYRHAWAALSGGNPLEYSAALAVAGYYTAGPDGYARGMAKRLRMVRGVLMGKPTLRVGGKYAPEVVREIQGIVGAAPSGIYDEATRAVVSRWQSRNGLDPDGVVGAESWATAYPHLEVLP